MRRSGAILPLGFLLFAAAFPARAPAKDYTRLVVFADLHLPGRLGPEKRKVVETVNGWKDVDGVAVPGDLAQGRGTPEEFAFAKDFLSRLTHPYFAIAGNHDYIYDAGPDGKTRKGSAATRRAKLKLFQETFALPGLRYEKRFGRYLALFISVDDLDSGLLAVMSSGTVAWLEDELRGNPDAPTIIFFHSPLKGAIQGRNEVSGEPSFMAQPADKLDEMLRRNPQVFLWVSGHTHIAPTNKAFRHKAGAGGAPVTDIHNCDMDGRSYLSDTDTTYTKHDSIWTNSLFLYPDKVVVKTYDHKKGAWLKALTREFRPPPKEEGPMKTKTITYLDRPGPSQGPLCLRSAALRAAELGLSHAVVASSSGKTALGLAQELRRAGSRAKVIGVGYSEDYAAKWGRLQRRYTRPAEALGAVFITGTHAMGGLNKAVEKQFGGLTPNKIVAGTFYTIGQGFKVAVEVSLMAADQGFLPLKKEVLALGGTGQGADTALVLKPATTTGFFSLRIREIVCLPR